jgi:methionyl-tRNA formyltransferase
MRFGMVGDETPFAAACEALLLGRGWQRDGEDGNRPDVVFAPLLRTRLGDADIARPRLGVLIFHPSLLPRHRGPDAVRHQVLGGETFGGVTWFWAVRAFDAGPICEQELVAIPQGRRPREVYEQTFVPAGLRCLERIAEQLERGYVRRVVQDEAAATYESFRERGVA